MGPVRQSPEAPHGSVVPRNRLVGYPGRFPTLGTDPRRVLPSPPHLHPSRRSRAPHLPKSCRDQSQSAHLPAGPCPSPTAGTRHRPSSRPAPGFTLEPPPPADIPSADKPPTPTPPNPPKKKGQGRKPLPASLPRKPQIYDVPAEQLPCPDCGTLRTRIGQEICEQLEYVPASLIVLQHVRPESACEACEGNIVIAERLPEPIEKSSALASNSRLTPK